MIDGAVRICDGWVETSIHELQNPQTGSEVAVIGTIHIGQQGYYDTIAQYIGRQQRVGARVHYESLHDAPPAEIAAARPEIRRVMRRLHGTIRANHAFFAGARRLTLQRDGLTYENTWENHDATYLALVQQLGIATTNRLVTIMKTASVVDRLPMPPSYRSRGVKWIFEHLMNTPRGASSALHEFDEQQNSVIIDYRNQVALGAADKRLASEPDANIVQLWGAEHIPGLHEGWRQRGYVQTGERWLSAFFVGRG